MNDQNFNHYPTRMLTFEYTALVDALSLQAAVRSALKSPYRLAGFSIETEHIVITDLNTGAHARAILDVPGMLRIHSPVEMQDILSQLVNRLIARRVVQLRPFVAKARVDEVKPFTPAFSILSDQMAQEDFKKFIVVLPEALEGAGNCKFRKDGALERYLQNLLRFTKAALDPANSRKPIKFLAQQAGLTHFAEGVGMTALRKYPEDYTAEYKGMDVIFPMHVTIGAGHHEEDCMSIHFLLDREVGKLILARFGRHGRGLSKS